MEEVARLSGGRLIAAPRAVCRGSTETDGLDPTHAAGTVPSIVLAFTRRVVRPNGNALLLDKENAADRWVRIEEAVASGRPFTVEARDDILAIDLDQPEHIERLMIFAQELREAGLAPVLVCSGRPGHVHLWCCVPDRDVFRRFRDRAKALGLQIRRSMRPPLAPHRQGLPVSLLDPEDPAEALAALTPTKGDPRPLPRWAQKMMSDGIFKPRYPSRSEMILGLAASAKNSDWTQEQYAAAILASTSRAGDKIRHRRDRDAYIARCWDMAELLISTSQPSMSAKDREQAREYLTMVGIAAAHHPWRGSGGASDRTVLRTHLLHAWGLGRIVYDLDVRTVSVVTHLSKSTVVTAQRRLRRAGWLLLVRPSRCPHAASWAVLPQFARQAKSELTRTHSIQGGCINVCSTEFTPVDLGHDTWARAGLGKSTARVYEHLHATEQIATTILAKILDIGLRMVRKHLAKLRQHELAVTDGRGHWLRGPADPATVAKTLGVAGLRQDRWERGLADREGHRTYLAIQSIRRMPYDDGANAVREIPRDAADGSPGAIRALAHGPTVDARPLALSTSSGMVGAARSRGGDPDVGGLVDKGVDRP
jgi:hypothetical protein